MDIHPCLAMGRFLPGTFPAIRSYTRDYKSQPQSHRQKNVTRSSYFHGRGGKCANYDHVPFLGIFAPVANPRFIYARFVINVLHNKVPACGFWRLIYNLSICSELFCVRLCNAEPSIMERESSWDCTGERGLRDGFAHMQSTGWSGFAKNVACKQLACFYFFKGFVLGFIH